VRAQSTSRRKPLRCGFVVSRLRAEVPTGTASDGPRCVTVYHTGITEPIDAALAQGPDLDIRAPTEPAGRLWTASTTCAMWYRTRNASIRRRPSSCPQLLPRSRSRGTGKIRTIRGPTEPQRPPLTPLPQFRGSQALYHQQTKNVLATPRSTPYGRRVHSEELAECAPQFRRQGSRIRANVDGTALSVTPTRSPVLIGSAKSSSTQDG
jgi:hypothetical protein